MIQETSEEIQTGGDKEFILSLSVQLTVTQLELEAELWEVHLNNLSPVICPMDQLFVPDHLRVKVLKFSRNSHLFCHPGINKTQSVARAQFWWPTLLNDGKAFVKTFLTTSFWTTVIPSISLSSLVSPLHRLASQVCHSCQMVPLPYLLLAGFQK